QKTFGHFVECISATAAVRCRIIGQRRSDQTKPGEDGSKGRVGHDFLTGPNGMAAVFVDLLRPRRHPPPAILAVIASRCTIGLHRGSRSGPYLSLFQGVSIND